ncbi:MAG: oligosaccharide flippase family protein [Actinomycetota bacterium]|nr:oligosaccharide flippase family protein [Actinomycetota bacterium]
MTGPPVAGVGDQPYGAAMRLVGAAALARVSFAAVTAIAGLAATVVSVRLLGPADYGLLAFAIATGGTLSGVAKLGLGLATTRMTAASAAVGDWDAVESTVRGSVTIVYALSAAAALAITAVVVGRGSTATAVSVPVAAGVSLLILGRNASVAAAAISRALGRVLLMDLPSLLISVLQVAAAVVLSVMAVRSLPLLATGFGVAGLVGTVVSLAIIRAIVRGKAPVIAASLREGARLVVTGAPYAIASAAGYVMARFDVLVLGLSHPNAVVGQYEPVLRLTERLTNLIPLIFMTAFLPAATRFFVSDDVASLNRSFHTSSHVTYVLSVPALLLLGAFPEPVIGTVFGPEVPARPLIVALLLAGYVVNLACGLNLGVLTATGDRKLIGATYVGGLAAMVVFALVLIPPFGAVGAATATAVSYVVLNVLVTWGLYTRYHTHVFTPRYVLTIVTSLLLLAAAIVLRHALEIEGFVGGAAMSAGLWLAWSAALRVTGILNWNEVRLLVPRIRRGGRDGNRKMAE